MPTIGEMFQVAVAHHQAGRLNDAEQLYRQILSNVPQHPDAWHLLGVIAYQVGKPEVAVEMIGRAIGLQGNLGVYHANQGEAYRMLKDFARAEPALLRAIELDPQHAEARNNYALLLQATGRVAESVAQLDAALRERPDYAEAHNNRGLALQALGRFAEARAEYLHAIRQRTGYIAPLENLERLGIALCHERQLDEARGVWLDYLSAVPDSPAALSNLAVVQFELQQYAEAAQSCQRAVQLQPALVEAWNNLGSSLLKLQRLDEAEQAFRQALEQQPDYLDALTNLGLLLQTLNRHDESVKLFERALQLQPQSVTALCGLGLSCYRQGLYHEASQFYQRAVNIEPDNTDALNKLGTCEMAHGRPDQAIPLFARCLQINPRFVVAHSNYLFCHLYLPDITLSRLAQLNREFEERHAAAFYQRPVSHANSRDPERRLRLGFLSADLRHHPIGFLLTEVFAQLDRQQFEIACYSTRRSTCEVRKQLQAAAVVWRDVETLEEESLAQQIRDDQVDLLFDLTGHTSSGRLLVFARRPAPVQLSWMGYPASTGISAIDYFIADEQMTPASSQPYFVEQFARLPEAPACYRPPQNLPPLSTTLPQDRRGTITFGSFNNLAKINQRVITLWSRVLRETPNSRMIIKFRALNEPAVQDRLAAEFAEQGITRDRLEFQGFAPMAAMLAAYNEVDLALDTFPYSGGTTTLLALLMGVPVVTLPGETMASRQSLSVLRGIGLDEVCARDEADFVAKTLALLGNRSRLVELRGSLRQKLLESPYCDSQRFMRQFQPLLRSLWKKWCAS